MHSRSARPPLHIGESERRLTAAVIKLKNANARHWLWSEARRVRGDQINRESSAPSPHPSPQWGEGAGRVRGNFELNRRTVALGLAALALPRVARAATLTDSAQRTIEIPQRVSRVFPSGPPAAILLYTLAPDLLIGWPRANRPEEREFLLPDVGARPEVGRLTGRGNTANLEVVLGTKPDLILDVGYVDATYVSLADRVQQQTGIPYALLDGYFA